MAQRYDVEAALLVDSGTSALRLALQSSAPASAPVRVALPAYGCYDLATASIGAGAEVSFYDIDPATLGPEWNSFAAALAPGLDAVVLVHQYGIPVDLDRAKALVDAHDAVLIEDAAQGAGAWWRHRRLGASGDLGVLSFGRGKGMTTGGGGALLARGPRGRKLLERARAGLGKGGRGAGGLGRLVAQAILSQPMLYGVPARMPWLALGDTPFHQPWEPHGIATAQAGVLRYAAELADRAAHGRRIVAGQLTASLGAITNVSLISPPAAVGTECGWLRYPILVETAERARDLATRCRPLGVAPGYPTPLPGLPALAHGRTGSWPGAERVSSTVLTLPDHQWVTGRDIASLAGVLRG